MTKSLPVFIRSSAEPNLGNYPIQKKKMIWQPTVSFLTNTQNKYAEMVYTRSKGIVQFTYRIPQYSVKVDRIKTFPTKSATGYL